MARIAIGILITGFLIFYPLVLTGSNYNKLILVEIQKNSLKLFENGELKKEFPVRVGKKETPTPTGEGYIFEKREGAIFRYQDPPNKGKIIRWSSLSDGRIIKVPYKKIRALGFRIKGHHTDKYSIHSVTDPATIGQAVSNGCIGMKIEDMLELYPLVEKGTKLIIVP